MAILLCRIVYAIHTFVLIVKDSNMVTSYMQPGVLYNSILLLPVLGEIMASTTEALPQQVACQSLRLELVPGEGRVEDKSSGT